MEDDAHAVRFRLPLSAVSHAMPASKFNRAHACDSMKGAEQVVRHGVDKVLILAALGLLVNSLCNAPVLGGC